MNVTSSGIINGVIQPQYGGHGTQFNENGIPYGGMTPPGKPYIYELHVYALDKMLDLEKGFLLNELYREMDGHILGAFTLKGIYEN